MKDIPVDETPTTTSAIRAGKSNATTTEVFKTPLLPLIENESSQLSKLQLIDNVSISGPNKKFRKHDFGSMKVENCAAFKTKKLRM